MTCALYRGKDARGPTLAAEGGNFNFKVHGDS